MPKEKLVFGGDQPGKHNDSNMFPGVSYQLPCAAPFRPVCVFDNIADSSAPFLEIFPD